WRTITDYLHWYNHERIHLGKYLKGLTPMEKLQIYQQRVLPLTVN
ncbi:MAG: IS3 family transposase, partial [Candidatus Kerfeldbacteria bacterium]|nr:IS3 family transposase [Candidatus Kerfeldbacteria bacterium]MBI5466315.1 IS3 family transposase [Candidatus Kerfeldbacteria bacterium]